MVVKILPPCNSQQDPVFQKCRTALLSPHTAKSSCSKEPELTPDHSSNIWQTQAPPPTLATTWRSYSSGEMSQKSSFLCHFFHSLLWMFYSYVSIRIYLLNKIEIMSRLSGIWPWNQKIANFIKAASKTIPSKKKKSARAQYQRCQHVLLETCCFPWQKKMKNCRKLKLVVLIFKYKRGLFSLKISSHSKKFSRLK